MKSTKLVNGIFRAKVTLYKTGNVCVILTNLTTGETTTYHTRKLPNGESTIYV